MDEVLTGEPAIDYEVATECFNRVIAWLYEAIRAEESQPDSDKKLLEFLRWETRRLSDAQATLPRHDSAAIFQVVVEYGPLVRHLSR